MIKSYIIKSTTTYGYCRTTPLGNINKGDIAEVSVAEFFGDTQHDLNRLHKDASVEPDLAVNGLTYQVKARRCGVTIERDNLHDTLQAYKCDYFIMACVYGDGYKCYELDKAQFEKFVVECFCKKSTESPKNKPEDIDYLRPRFRLEKTDKAIINYLDRL